LGGTRRTLLLGPRRRLLDGDWPGRAPALAALLARGTPIARPPGDQPCFARAIHLEAVDGAWPIAALTRAFDGGEVADAVWIRADPAHVRADAVCLRLLACGDLRLSRADVDGARQAVAPILEAAGIRLETPHPARWYLRLPPGTPVPRWSPPDRALGDDLSRHLPAGPETARWLRLLNEVQIALHHAGFNRDRAARGLVALNSLWFWGAGTVPRGITVRPRRIASADPILLGALRLAGLEPCDYAAAAPASPGDSLVDLRRLDDVALVERDWLAADLAALQHGRFARIELLFEDADGVGVDRWQAWRLWRRRPA
jgi:hypothetical protein